MAKPKGNMFDLEAEREADKRAAVDQAAVKRRAQASEHTIIIGVDDAFFEFMKFLRYQSSKTNGELIADAVESRYAAEIALFASLKPEYASLLGTGAADGR